MTVKKSLGGAALVVGLAVAGVAAPTAVAAPATDAAGGVTSEAAVRDGAAAARGWRYEVAKRTSAEPGSDDPIESTLANPRAMAKFERHGDEFWVYDRKRDGRSAAALFKVRHGKKVICRNRWGKGTWAICDLDLSETRHILYKVGSSNCDKHHCSKRRAWKVWPRKWWAHAQ